LNGPQDVGGKQGLGPVVGEPDEPVFHDEWERRVFALSFCSWLSSGVTVDQSRQEQAAMPYDRYYGSAYYERWLYALERLMIERGVVTPAELESGTAEAGPPTPPVIEPSQLAAVAIGLAENGVTRLRPARDRPAFEVGQRVRARNLHPRTYDRLPTYVKGRLGVVDALCGAFAHPEDLAAGRIDRPGAHCYRVRFAATELWGPSAERPGDSLCIDLFENYLEPA
jgi:nitrile hydratase beta subunit